MGIVPQNKPPTRAEAEAIVRNLTTSGAVSWSKHSKDRMKERDITIPQILNCLAKGKITEDPVFTYTNGGGYETAVEKNTAGRWLKVVVCIKLSEKLLIVTVY